MVVVVGGEEADVDDLDCPIGPERVLGVGQPIPELARRNTATSARAVTTTTATGMGQQQTVNGLRKKSDPPASPSPRPAREATGTPGPTTVAAMAADVAGLQHRPEPEGHPDSCEEPCPASSTTAGSPPASAPLFGGSGIAGVEEAASPAFQRLEAQLEQAQEALKFKEVEVEKLSRIRDEVESEMSELTASLFQEAHRMVGEANCKRVSAEKSLAEANMKIDGLETEVAALKTLVLTSTPSKPNWHLHPHIDPKFQQSAAQTASGGGGGSNRKLSPSSSLSSIVIGAGGLSNSTAVTSELLLSENRTRRPGAAGGEQGVEPAATTIGWSSPPEEDRSVDPSMKKEYMEWKKAPTMDPSQSPFIRRIFAEDVEPCLNFPTGDEALKRSLRESVLSQTICITPLKPDRDLMVKHCPLLDSPQVLCKYRVRLGGPAALEAGNEGPGCGTGEDQFCVSQLARNRIAAVCNCITYLDYILKGLVKSHHNDVYWEILQLRKSMALARLGFNPGS